MTGIVSEFFEYAAKLYERARPNPELPRGEVTCPRCRGRGGRNQTPGGGFALNPGNRMEWVPCGTCGGPGRVPA